MTQTPADLDITTFLVSSIHDMKNSVSVMTALLEDAVSLQKEHACPACSQIGQVFYEAQRVNDNLIQLVTLYKIDQQFYPFDPQEHEMSAFLEEVLARVTPLAEYRKIEVLHECPDGLQGYFDRELIFGTIVQALHNGLRYTHSKILLTVGERDGFLEFRVEDDGSGYPESMLTGDISPNQGIRFATGSTGLGLYFSQVVARIHRNRGRVGTTRLENGGRLGGGVFIMTLP
ncbi:MAG: HAMP domain-containing sensor histidine kinase [Rhodocyclaceae bacterium]|nr:HAMP domain-containing sensor histidine kinase [Rhodocyclaceae bacterium]